MLSRRGLADDTSLDQQDDKSVSCEIRGVRSLSVIKAICDILYVDEYHQNPDLESAKVMVLVVPKNYYKRSIIDYSLVYKEVVTSSVGPILKPLHRGL